MPEKPKLIEELLDLQIPIDVQISPNAQQVAYTTEILNGHRKGEHALSTIWLADTGKAHSARQLTSGLYNDHGVRWSPDGQSVAFISDRGKQGESSAIYVLPIGVGGEAYPITPVENERSIARMEWSLDGKFIAYVSADEKTAEKKAKEKEKDDANVWGEDWAYQRLKLVHVATKKEWATLSAPDAHVTDFDWNNEGTAIAYAWQNNPDIESKSLDGIKISIIDLSGKQSKQVCTWQGWMGDFVWAGDCLYFTGPADGRSIISDFMVWCVDLDTESPTYKKYAYGETNTAQRLSKAGKDVTVVVQENMEAQIRMLDGRTLFSRKKEIETWDAAFTTDSDEMILAIAQDDTNSPCEVYTVTASGGALVQLSNHGEVLQKRKFGTPTFLSCESTSVKGEASVRIDGLFVTPSSCKTTDGKPDKPLPTIVSIHGGPNSRNTDQFNPAYYMWTPLFLDAGYAVLTVNYRGSLGRGEKFASFSHGGMGAYDYADVIEMVQHAIKEGFADKEKLIVSGWSQGGFLSYLCSTRNGQHGYGWKFKGAIPGAGVTNWETMSLTSDIGYAEGDMAGSVPWKSEKTEVSNRQGSAIWEFAEALKQKSIPHMLILHGEQDARVPIEQARGFRRALLDARLPFEYVTYPREGHDFVERKHWVDMAERVMSFVDMHIGGM